MKLGNSARCAVLFLASGVAIGSTPETAVSGGAELSAPAWMTFVQNADFDAVSQSYAALANFAGPDGPDVAQCQEHLPGLLNARQVNPFSPALQAMVERCVQRMGDLTRLKQERARGLVLREFLLAAGAGSSALQPIQVAAEADAAVLIEALGGEPLYARYSVGSSSGSLPFVAVYFDPALGRERQLVFDFLRLWQRLQNHDAADQYPAMLSGLTERYLDEAAVAGNVTAELAKISADLARHELTVVQAVRHLEEMALGGSAAASIELLPMCLVLLAQDRCAEDALDLLRPHAERGLGEAMLVMALAADAGVAGAGGARQAQEWLARAADRVGAAQAQTAFAQLALNLRSEGKLSRAAAASLRRAARAGHAPAQMLLAATLRSRRITPLRGEKAAVWVERAATAGLAAAQAQLAMQALRRSDDAGAQPLLEQAAAKNDPGALGLLALSLDSLARNEPAKGKRALELYRQAASFGNAGAMRRLADAYAQAQLGLPIDMSRAEAWYLSASMFGNRRAAAELADLYLKGTAGVVGKPADGYAVIERLAADGLTSARLRMAMALLQGQGVDADPALALQLLSELADAGVAAADFRLGQIYEFEQGKVPRDLAAARSHYRAAADAGHLSAIDFYARALYAGRGGPRDRSAALDWWEKAVRKGHRPSIANLAWARCSSPEPKVLDPLAGTRLVSDALQRQPSANLSDTLAVCLAASGLYREAVDTQKQTLELANREPGLNAAQTQAFRERLLVFQRGEAWVEAD